MGNIFNMDNKFFTFMGRLADLMILNILCIVCCLPIVTAGASITALYYVTMKMARNEEAYIVKSFFKSLKENFRQATIINIIMVVTAVFLFMDLRLTAAMEGNFAKVLTVIFMCFTFIYLLIFVYIYPVLAKFYNTIKKTFVNAILMAVRHLPYTIAMLLTTVSPVLILFIPSFRIQSFIMMLFLIMGFGCIAYLNSTFLVKIFDNYIPKEEEEEKEEDTSDVIIEESTQALLSKKEH